MFSCVIFCLFCCVLVWPRTPGDLPASASGVLGFRYAPSCLTLFLFLNTIFFHGCTVLLLLSKQNVILKYFFYSLLYLYFFELFFLLFNNLLCEDLLKNLNNLFILKSTSLKCPSEAL